VLICVAFTDAGQQIIRWQAGSVVLPIPDSGQQIQWGSNVQQLGREASKLALDGSTATVTASQLIVRHSSGGQVQTIAAVDGGIAEIQFNRKPTGVSSAGDLWAVGHRSFDGANGFFSIGCNLTNVTLSISPSGTVNIPYSLTVGSVAVERIPWISALVQANGVVVSNRGQKVATCLKGTPSPITGEYNIFWQQFNHPDVMNYLVHVTPCEGEAFIYVSTMQSNQVRIVASTRTGSPIDNAFFITIY
jgi:hypothetical protein